MLQRSGAQAGAAARLDLADLVRALSPLAVLGRLPHGARFALLGTLLFAVRALGPDAGGDDRVPLAIGAAQVEAWAADFAAQLGRPPSPAELRSLAEQQVGELLLESEARRLRLDFGDRSIEQRLIGKARAIASDPGAPDEELYRQAIALGLDDDLVIRRQLREKMRLFLQREAPPRAFTAAELADALVRHAESFRQPPAFSLAHLFVAAAQHGERAQGRAAALREEIVRRGLPVEQALLAGDPFPLAAQAEGRTRQQLAKTFGGAFAVAVAELEPGAWSAPIASPYGWHLVYLKSRTEGGLPAAEELREPLQALLAEERAAARLQQGIARLRREYPVEIEWPAAFAGEIAALERDGE